ncbi:MAG: hypothetical protein DI630_00215 [Gordonia sp. (in: high G+C Gram-positive bacteria)]|nr:MAG: hypothetical protein DI630_00215 [Gordonia sp. (in: high G+C Gram-positive bacteria)]
MTVAMAAGVVAAASAGCSSDKGALTHTTDELSPTATTVAGGSIADVDANEYITDSSRNLGDYYGFQIVSSTGQLITECSMAPTATSATTVAPGGHYPACSVTFPADTPPVSSPPFEGKPNAVRIENGRVVEYISEGFTGPNLALKELPPNSRIVVGDAECLSLPEGGVDCTKGSNGFRYASGVLSERIASTPTRTDEGQAGVQVSTSVIPEGPPMEGPYTEGTTPAVPGTACGAATGRRVVTVVSGPISCTDALAVMDKYLALPNDGSYGNANIRQFDGWSCVSPTAASAQRQGFGSKCSKDDIVLTTPI